MLERVDRPELPPSATDGRIVLSGIAGAMAAIALGLVIPDLNPINYALLICAGYALPIAVLEILVLRVHRRPTTGIDWSRPLTFDWSRIACKVIGVVATLFAVYAIHVFFRFYSFSQLSVTIHALVLLFPTLTFVTLLYIALTDSRMDNPKDAYWTIGAVLLAKAPVSALLGLRDHAIGWAVKGFFLPVMFFGLYANMAFAEVTIARIGTGPLETALGLIGIALMVDLTIACVGYSLTLRVLDAHIRSPNGLLGAWVVTLICYEPFNRLTSSISSWRQAEDWTDIVSSYPALILPWSALLLASYVIWIWATAIYGLRWSNLTNRGIITAGPYRYTKHPDYVAKSTFFWLTAVPFVTATGTGMAVMATVALIATNLIYFGRARMEEKHLSEDPVYVAYATAMNERSIFRGVARVLPFLRYRAPGDANREASVRWPAPETAAE